jgi:hypothetical protein
MRNFLSIVLLLISMILHGQTPVGSWSDHLAYNTTDCVAVSTDQVFASTGSSIIIYNKTFAELKKMSRIDGLTETGINTISWSEENKTLVIAYTSTNIDLLQNNMIYNIPDISRKNIPGEKKINRIRTTGKYAYLACSFGIVVVDLIKREIYDTWKPGNGSDDGEVWDIAFGNGKIYAATNNGVYSADLSNQGLSYFGKWNLVSLLPNPVAKYTLLTFSGNVLYVNFSDPLSGGDQVYAVSDISSLFLFKSGVFNRSFDSSVTGFTISSGSSVKYFNPAGTLVKTISSYGWAVPNIAGAIADNSDIWIADMNSGLVRGENMSEFTALTLPGPVSNNAFNITSLNGKTVVCGGAADASWNNLGRPLQVSIFENNSWTSLQSGTITDPMRALIDPLNSDHIFVSTWGGGLLEYKNNNLVKQYTASNSPLQTTTPGPSDVRVCGLAMDKSENLWLTQSGVSASIKIIK